MMLSKLGRKGFKGTGSPPKSRAETRESVPVIFFTHTSEPGGGELALARYLQRTALSNVALFAASDGMVWQPVVEKGVQVVKTSPSDGLSGFVKLYYLAKSIGSIHDGVLVANSMRTALLISLFKRRRTTFVYWVRDGLENSSVSLLGTMITRRFTLRRADYCLANSNWTASTIRAAYPRVPVEVRSSPCGIEDNNVVDHTHPNGDIIRLLYLGRIARWKGVDVAVSAVKMLNKEAGYSRYSLDIVGAALFDEEEFRIELVDLIGDDSDITMLGHKSNVSEILSEYDGLLHCSVRPEPFGQVIVQAMNAGLIVFATNHGGPTEIIRSGVDGFLLKPHDIQALVDCVDNAFADATLVTSFRAAAIERGQTYSDRITISLLDQYFELVSNNQEARRG